MAATCGGAGRFAAAGWRIALENPDQAGATYGLLTLAFGALATSGDARRSLLKDGVRYSRLPDPTTGRPVANPPRSVTVATPTCLEAGAVSTPAMPHAAGAEAFLKREEVQAGTLQYQSASILG